MLDEKTNDNSYFNEYQASYSGQMYKTFLTPQLLNDNIKNINMNSTRYSSKKVAEMVAQPKYYENELRKLSFNFYNNISMYKKLILLWSKMLTFDWNPIPYTLDGKPISLEEMSSSAYKKDFASMTKFFNGFNVKEQFSKVLWNICMYDTYYTSIRVYEDKTYLQELPSEYCMIDSDSYYGYLYSFDLSYFQNSGVDINAFAPEIKQQYANALKRTSTQYNPNLPNRNGRWVQWSTITPDEGWVFKFNRCFAGSVPPLLSDMIDYTKLDKYKNLEEVKKELEAYKVIVATVPRMTNNKSGNKADDFSISATELGKFSNSIKATLNDGIDFKAAPLEDFKAFDFSPSGNEKDLLETELKNIMLQSGISEALSLTGNVNVASANIYKIFNSAIISDLYYQFERFCEYQVNKRTKKYKFKIHFEGTVFDREERYKNSNTDMQNGVITPSIFTSRGISVIDSTNIINMVYSMNIPEMFKPVQTANTMGNDKKTEGRPVKSDGELSDAGAATRTSGSNQTTKEKAVN